MDVTVKCTNQDCAQFDIEKTVGRAHLGNHVYQGGALLCDCGFKMKQITEDE